MARQADAQSLEVASGAGGAAMKLKTGKRINPIPTNKFDWSAWIDGQEEWGSGFGPTRDDAIDNLSDLLKLRCTCKTDSETCIYCEADLELYRICDRERSQPCN